MRANPKTYPGVAKRLPRALARLALAGLVALAAAACTAQQPGRAAVVIIDISRGYADELDKARLLTNFLLTELEPGDSIAVAFVDNTAYSDRNFIAQADFGHRPSVVTDQKRQVRSKVKTFLDDFEVPSAHSDITGGILLARDYLRGTDAQRKQIYLLSDLNEDLPPKLDRSGPLELDGIEVVALNVTRGERDNIDPARYRQRLSSWQQRIEDGGGTWKLVNEIGRLEQRLAAQAQ